MSSEGGQASKESPPGPPGPSPLPPSPSPMSSAAAVAAVSVSSEQRAGYSQGLISSELRNVAPPASTRDQFFSAWLDKITQQTEEELKLIRSMKPVQTTAAFISDNYLPGGTNTSVSSMSSSTSSAGSNSAHSAAGGSQRKPSVWSTQKQTEVSAPINDPELSMFEETLMEVNSLFEARQVSRILATEFKQSLEELLQEVILNPELTIGQDARPRNPFMRSVVGRSYSAASGEAQPGLEQPEGFPHERDFPYPAGKNGFYYPPPPPTLDTAPEEKGLDDHPAYPPGYMYYYPYPPPPPPQVPPGGEQPAPPPLNSAAKQDGRPAHAYPYPHYYPYYAYPPPPGQMPPGWLPRAPGDLTPQGESAPQPQKSEAQLPPAPVPPPPPPSAQASSAVLRWSDDDLRPLRDEIVRLQGRRLVQGFLVSQLRDRLETMVRRRLVFFSASARAAEAAPARRAQRGEEIEGGRGVGEAQSSVRENIAALESTLTFRKEDREGGEARLASNPPPPPPPQILNQQQQLQQQQGTTSGGGVDFAALMREMEILKGLVKTCLELQVDTQRSIKQEVAAALSGGLSQAPGAVATATVTAVAPVGASKAEEGGCVLCDKGTVDCLIYRCGHVCCCLQCAKSLQAQSLPCPVCRAPIVDIVVMYKLK